MTGLCPKTGHCASFNITLLSFFGQMKGQNLKTGYGRLLPTPYFPILHSQSDGEASLSKTQSLLTTVVAKRSPQTASGLWDSVAP